MDGSHYKTKKCVYVRGTRDRIDKEFKHKTKNSILKRKYVYNPRQY